MIKRLQRKFILIAMGSLSLVLLVIIGSLNLVNLYRINSRADGTLRMLAEHDGGFPENKAAEAARRTDRMAFFDFEMTEETRYETRFFTLLVNQDGIILQVNMDFIAAVSADQARSYALNVLKKGRDSGYFGVYKYLVTDKGDGKMIVFLDCRQQIQSAVFLLLFSSAIALGCLAVVFLLVAVLSRRAIKPVLESMEKQKQFITDAGHEIKTPLAIISANTDVLELYQGKNEWVDSIRSQTRRLNGLIHSLLLLSKLEEDCHQPVAAKFCMSKAVEEAAAPFKTLAETQKKHFELQIQPDLYLTGEEAGIQQLVSILVDNAVKYADDNGIIRVTLSQAGRSVRLEVYNTEKSLPEGDLSRLFDRFYRADASRSRETGGYGIGLSIAKAIVQAHRGKIMVRRIPDEENPAVCFAAVL